MKFKQNCNIEISGGKYKCTKENYLDFDIFYKIACSHADMLSVLCIMIHGILGILCTNRLQESDAHTGSHCCVGLTEGNGISEARARSLGRLYE